MLHSNHAGSVTMLKSKQGNRRCICRGPAKANPGKVLLRGEALPSKSGGKLHVMIQLDPKSFKRFFGRNQTLRIYRVSEIPKGGTGAREFHKLRYEIIAIERGAFRLRLEDLAGNKQTVLLKEGMTYGAILPHVLHTYVALSDRAALLVVANTPYDHKRPTTHDSYPESEFRHLQSVQGRRKGVS